MKTKQEYRLGEKSDLMTRYRTCGEMSSGGPEALEWYLRGIETAKKGAVYDRKNYENYYFYRKHYRPYEKKGLQYFEDAAECFKRSAELGNELAMMNYALYLFAFKDRNKESLKWFFAASEAGLATADYEIAVLYKNGYCDLEVSEEKANMYLQQYQKRCEESERQFILAWDVDGDWNVLGRSHMFGWFCGSVPEIYDTPGAKPSKWKYKH